MARSFSLADLYEIVAATVPDRVALVGGRARLTYRQLDERADRLGHHLVGLGVQPGDKVGILSWNRAEWLEAFLAAFKVRAVPINLNYRYVTEELRYVLDNADVSVLVVEKELEPLVAEVRADLPLLRHLVVIDGDYEDALAAAPAGPLGIERSSDDLYMLYTGGTTGMPKGVMWRQEDIFFAALGGGGFGQPPIRTPEEIAERVQPEETAMVSMANAPMMHGASQWIAMITLFGGGKVVLYTDHHFDPDAVWRLVEQERANNVLVVGDAMARPLAEALAAPGASYDTSSVFVVGSGGAILSAAVKEQLRAQLPDIIVMDSFGASETGAGGRAAGDGARFHMDDFMAVLDDDLRPVEPGSGVIGRLARRGHVPLGYYKDEAKTAATFVTDPDGVRWSVPGDLATVESDGTVILLGRGSGCINTGGEKVFPEEVEAALKRHPDVFDALVVGVPDERFGERVAAVVQPRPGRQPTLEDLAAHCREHVAGYKVPRELQLTDSIGRTPAGKPDYRWAKSVLAGKEQ